MSRRITFADTTTAPPYQNTVRPNQTLNNFDGQNAQGTWRLEICDIFASQDNGTFQRASLFITPTGATLSDLSLTKTVSNANPASGANISYTLSVNNTAASTNATGVTVLDTLPTGVTFVSATGTGSYNNTTGVWTLGTVNANQTLSITITVTVSAPVGTTVTNFAEITASSNADPDSTPNNGSITEDDDASVAFTTQGTRSAGTPPTLSCLSGSTLFDWSAVTWTAGSLNNSYTIANVGTVGFAISTTGTWINDAAFGGLTPAISDTANTGGFAADETLNQNIDFASQSQVATTVISLGSTIPGAQFRIYDIDFAANDFADKITITGSAGGTSVTPTVTNGTVNFVVGNVAIGDGASGGTAADGNIVVTFSQAIDTITIVYGNATTAPANPDGQAISITDITFCNPLANLSISKTSVVWSGSTFQYAVPGSDMTYSINVAATTSGATSSDSIFVVDSLPSTLRFFNGDANGGAAGTDPVYFTSSSSGLTFNYATDVRFSNAVPKPTSFAGCTYTLTAPVGSYDAGVRHICINPKGTMAGVNGATIPSFSMAFRAAIQ